ncbi:MAG: hypothetical protein AAF693_06235 [Bacteroidota bacterium]
MTYWIREWFEEPPTYESILEDYHHLIIDPTTLLELKKYFKGRRFILRMNEDKIRSVKKIYDQLYPEFDFSKKEDRRAIVSSKIFVNTLNESFETSSYLFEDLKYHVFSSHEVKDAINKELKTQRKKL